MSSDEISSKHRNNGAEKKNVKLKKISGDVVNGTTSETNDFDYKKEKPPARSTYIHLIKTLDKKIVQTAHTVPVYNAFDRIKMCIDLRLHGEAIEFEILDILYKGILEEPKSFVEKKMESRRQLQVACSKLLPSMLKKLDSNEIDEWEKELCEGMVTGDIIPTDEAEPEAVKTQTWEVLEESEQEIEEEPFETRIGNNIYPNCWIEQHKLPLGLNALYIKDDRLIIDVTGKFMADTGFLGCIDVHNIAQCLIKIRDLNHVHFNVAVAIEVATVRLCDVTLDLHTLAQDNFIRALSSIYPIYSAKNIIKKYGNSSIMIKSKAEKVKKSFIVYDKGKEVRYKRGHYTDYWFEIGDEGLEVADHTLRLEAHLFTFDSMRKYLALPEGEIKLPDLLRSTAPVMINILADYNITEEKLRGMIKSHVDEYLPEVNDVKDLTKVLAAEKVTELLACQHVVELFEQQQYECSALNDMIALEYGITKNDKLMKGLSPYLKDCCYTYLLHYKPKTIKLLLELLELIHAVYGRNSDMKIDGLEEVA